MYFYINQIDYKTIANFITKYLKVNLTYLFTYLKIRIIKKIYNEIILEITKYFLRKSTKTRKLVNH
uniref:Uncharacterized protein n=1 Tax=Dictyomenia sonderi TaxID=2007178 RepID=A0A1Z1MTM6_9FLOR|nr:hypothetical protein [Dictyomenia sonderi]ARW69125.1 hypothetical protein [Dictyomenia sonderi]